MFRSRKFAELSRFSVVSVFPSTPAYTAQTAPGPCELRPSMRKDPALLGDGVFFIFRPMQSGCETGTAQCRTSAINAPKPTNIPPVNRLNACATLRRLSVAPIRVPNNA
jgi:hypothetical protein